LRNPDQLFTRIPAGTVIIHEIRWKKSDLWEAANSTNKNAQAMQGLREVIDAYIQYY
jgi:hypothetical protein